MKAWRFYGTGKPLQLDEVPEPTPGPGEVVVDVKAAGVCHSDVSAIDDPGWMPLFPDLPRTMGHESAGVISAVGEGVTDWQVGDRVGLSPLTPDGSAIGYGTWDGGFGPKLRAPVECLVALPDAVPFDLGAMATDAGLTAYGAIVGRGGLKEGMKVGVIGLGGLGYLGARIAVLKGAEVYAAEVNPATRDLAEEIGLAGVGESITEFAGKNLELIVDYAGFGTTTSQAIEAVGLGGTVVQVGMGKLEALVNTYLMITKRINYLGSNSGTTEDLAGIYEMMATQGLKGPINHITHADIPDAIDKLRVGGVIGRFVAMYE